MSTLLTCPRCGYPQYCACHACIDKLPAGYTPQKEIAPDVLACAFCGFAMHIDGWEKRGMELFAAFDAHSPQDAG